MFSRIKEEIGDALDICDGIVLTGGRDIEPLRYGQDPHPSLGTTDRTAMNLNLSWLGQHLIAACR